MHDARGKTEHGKAKPAALYSASGMAKLVQRLRQVAKLSQTFSLDACRHGGMTELEEAELTDGQGRALSAHTSKAYEGYAKRTMMRALAASRKRHAHRLAIASADVTGTEFQNGPRNAFQNERGEQNVTANS
jgi:3-polyprenyl-4-hydroxybenzoate decarboxylase